MTDSSALGIPIFIAILGTLVSGIGSILFVRWLLNRIRIAVARRIADATPDPHDIVIQDVGANFFGLSSYGGMQIRGNGGLVLTADCLRFFMLVPQREIDFPLNLIEQTNLVRSHCGKTIFRDLLCVTYRTCNDATEPLESAAWYVSDPHQWKQLIDERCLRGSRNTL